MGGIQPRGRHAGDRVSDPLSGAPPQAGAESLARLVRAGLGWSMVNTVLNRLWILALGVILARILEPRDFGVFAVGLVALNILQSMNELGVTLGIVRWQGDPLRAARTATTLALTTSALLYLCCFALAPALASALSAPEATGVLRLLALGVVVDAVSSIPNALLTREFLQARRAIADTVALAGSSAVTILLAQAGFGAWSLAWGSLVGNVIATTLILALAPARPRPGFRPDDARRLLAFGLPLAGSSFLVFAMLNADYVVVGRVLGPVALGFYLLAFNLSSWPANLLSVSVRRVAIAGFAQLVEQPDRLRARFVQSFGMLAGATVLPCILLSLLALPLVRFVYGERWEPAASALRFLAVLGGLRVVVDLCYDLLVAAGRSRATLLLQGVWLVVLVPALVVGADRDGTRGVAVAHALVALVVAAAFLVSLRASGIGTLALLAALARPAAAGVLAGAALLAATAAIEGDLPRLALGGTVAAVVYGLVAVPVRPALREVRARRAQNPPA